MPEVFYGFNRFYITNPKQDILIEFAPICALSLSAYAKQKAFFKGKSVEEALS